MLIDRLQGATRYALTFAIVPFAIVSLVPSVAAGEPIPVGCTITTGDAVTPAQTGDAGRGAT